MVNAFAQLALDMRWDESADLARFIASGNEQALAAVSALATPQAQSLYLTGAADSGKSHLLQAACGAVSATGQTAVYLPLKHYVHNAPGLLEGVEHLQLVAIDDVDALTQSPSWQEALFHCYNRMRETGALLLVASCMPPAGLNHVLPDLTSRLNALLRLSLTPPDDARREAILAAAVARRGLDLPAASRAYLLHRQARDLNHLMQLIERLDTASLQAGRRLTVPFIREVLAQDSLG